MCSPLIRKRGQHGSAPCFHEQPMTCGFASRVHRWRNTRRSRRGEESPPQRRMRARERRRYRTGPVVSLADLEAPPMYSTHRTKFIDVNSRGLRYCLAREPSERDQGPDRGSDGDRPGGMDGAPDHQQDVRHRRPGQSAVARLFGARDVALACVSLAPRETPSDSGCSPAWPATSRTPSPASRAHVADTCRSSQAPW